LKFCVQNFNHVCYLAYFVTVYLVTLRKITALLWCCTSQRVCCHIW